MTTFAAIDVGSYELAMKIFEISGKGNIKEIDHIRHRIELGTDTYNTGKINNERVDELCDYLLEFKRIIKSYKVDAVKVYGTSALRETKNSIIITERIKIKTGFNVEILSNSEQSFLHYKAVASKGSKFETMICDGTVIVDIGGGSIQISVFDKSRLITTQNIRLGILRIREMLSDIQPKTTDYIKLVEELVDNHLCPFKTLYLNDIKIKNIIIVDNYISSIIQKAFRKELVSSDEYSSFMDKIKNSNINQLFKQYGLGQESASLLPASAVLLMQLIKHTDAVKIWAPGVSLSDGIVWDFSEKEKLIKGTHDFDADIISGAENIGKRYHANEKRNDLVWSIAKSIFDGTKKIHGMGPRERLLLRVATILGDCGKYMSFEEAAECSYEIIMKTELIGLSHIEREIVANVVKFNKMHFVYYDELAKTTLIDKKSYLIMAKLTAIFRIADGVCRSYRTKINDIKINLKEDVLVINVDCDEDVLLEIGFFERKARFFEDAFSVKPVLKHKKKITGE